MNDMSGAGPSQDAKAPPGGSAAAFAASVGVGITGAGPSQVAKAPPWTAQRLLPQAWGLQCRR